MKRIAVLVGLLAILLVACGKYGPPQRSRPAPPPSPTSTNAPAETAPDDEQQEQPP